MSEEKNWRYFQQNSASCSGIGRGRPPKNLKGKQIGLWYADRAKRRKDFESRAERANKELLGENDATANNAEIIDVERESKKIRPLGSILLSEQKKQHINRLLSDSVSLYAPASQSKNTAALQYEHLEETEFKHEFLRHINGNIFRKLQSISSLSNNCGDAAMNEKLLNEFNGKQTLRAYQKMQEVRERLPSMGMKQQILELIEKNQITVISGETGCGKTTQVAQFILDDFIRKGKGSHCKIVCTQPRRISAISVAERVAAERNELLGISVGFQIRLEKTPPRDRGSILFCTTGVLLKFMESDPALREISHLILDEIHERDVTSDFLITVLKDVIQYRKDIKIVLMSATLNSEAFSKYYNNAPHINIPGFTYPVEEYFLEDVLQLTRYKFKDDQPKWRKKKRERKEWSEFIEPYLRALEQNRKYDRHVVDELRKIDGEKIDIVLIYELLVAICENNANDDDGGILIFVPGFAEISKLSNFLRDSRRFPEYKYIIIPLHSQLPTVDQKQIFYPAPKGQRKIIIATNIAETSITIEDVTVVIDSGFIKISNIDAESGIETLKAEFVSQANAAQRKGRAGRVKPGVCYHLITKVRFDLLDKFLKPEVLRKSLEDVILQLKMLQLGAAQPFLTKLMDPPEARSIQSSLILLQRLGALDLEESLTPLGYHMAKLPVPAQCSKMLILAALFSCVDPILSIAASLGYKDAYQLNLNDDKAADKKKYELSRGTNSDHICMHYAIRGFEDASNPREFCRKYSLSFSILRLLVDMRRQFAKHLYEMKFISNDNPRSYSDNLNSGNISLIKAIISAGLYPNVAIVGKIKKHGVQLKNITGERMEFHPKSVLYRSQSFPSPLVVYHLRLKSSKIFVHDATVVFPLPLVFFGDKFKIHEYTDGNYDEGSFVGISINDNIRFICSESTSLAIQDLRERLNQILEWKISHPGSVSWSEDNREMKILRVIMDMITTEDSENMDLSDFDDS